MRRDLDFSPTSAKKAIDLLIMDYNSTAMLDVGVRWYGCRAMMLKTVAAVPSVVTKVETISPPWDFVDTRKSKLRSSKFIS